MEDEAYLREFRNRTTSLLGADRMAELQGKTVAIAGCGGVGGAAAMTLARLGVGGFVLADPGIYDPPDANRQWAADRRVMDRNKAAVHQEILQAIQPGLRLQVYEEGVTEENLEDFLDGVDLVVDCLDISVPLALRTRVYRTAQARGLTCISAPIFGFGTLVLVASPEGMGMDAVIERFIHTASTRGTLPPGFSQHLFPPHLAPIQERVASHSLPSCSISVTLATGIVCADVARILLSETYDDLPPPVTLPEIFVVEPLRRTYKTCHWRSLFEGSVTAEERQQALSKVSENPALVPGRSAWFDGLSDSWADRWESFQPRPGQGSRLEAVLGERFAMPHVLPVMSGRFAESLVAPLLVSRGSRVLTNGSFPTTRFHLEQAGAEVVDLATSGSLDLETLDLEDVSVVWVEAANNANGGLPLTVDQLIRIRDAASARGIPVVLDACRLHTQACVLGLLIEPHVHEMCALADVVVASLTKDFQLRRGAFVGCRDPELLHRLRERTGLMVGTGLHSEDRDHIVGAVTAPSQVEERCQHVAELAAALVASGVPLVRAGPGHAVFLDAGAWLPDHTEPAWALAHALYAQAGIRAAPNMGARPWVRMACPVALHRESAHAVARAVCSLQVSDVRATPTVPGVLGDFLVALEVG